MVLKPEPPPPLDLKPMKIEVPIAEPPPPVDIPPPEKVGVVLPEPEPPLPVDLKPPPTPPKKVEKVKPKEKKPPAAEQAPQAAPEQSQQAVAPRPGASFDPPSNTLPTWKGLLLRHLERHKRYPSEAQRARLEGVTYVRFTMSRDGRVIAVRIERASGIASLDQEGLNLLQRASPLPPLPTDQPGETMELVVPIQFYLRR